MLKNIFFFLLKKKNKYFVFEGIVINIMYEYLYNVKYVY